MTEHVVSRAAKYGRVPVSLLFREDATGDECRLYAYLTTFDFKLKGEAWPGRELAAQDLRWSLRKLDGVLGSLADHDEIRRVQAGNGRPARIELAADVISEAALHDLAALPNHVDSPARSGKCTSSRTRNERERDAVVERAQAARRIIDANHDEREERIAATKAAPPPADLRAGLGL